MENFFDVEKLQDESTKLNIKNKVEELYNKKIKPYPNYQQWLEYKYEAGTSWYVHNDWGGHSDVTCLCYINDNYEGGQIYFPDYSLEIKPSQGSLLVFDSLIRHGVKTIKSGTRLSMGSWWNFMEDGND